MKQKTSKAFTRIARLFLAFALALLIAVPWEAGYAQRRGGSFGGGSFGGGRSFGGGGSFGGSRSSGGSFGGGGGFFGGSRSSGSTGSFGGSRSYGGSGSFGGTRSGSSFGGSSSSGGSFGRSGSFGSSGIGRSTSVYNRSAGTYINGGRTYYVHPGGGGGFWAGYSLGYWSSPAWYYYTPFHPAFYVGQPYVGPDGYVYGGGFSWLHFFIGIAFFGFLIWLVVRLFGGSKRVRYTSY